jgi:hypothetical protein
MGLDAFTPTDKLRAEAAEETFVVIEDEEFREEMAVRRSLPPATEAQIKSVRGTYQSWTLRRCPLLVRRSSPARPVADPVTKDDDGEGARMVGAAYSRLGLLLPLPLPAAAKPQPPEGQAPVCRPPSSAPPPPLPRHPPRAPSPSSSSRSPACSSTTSRRQSPLTAPPRSPPR